MARQLPPSQLPEHIKRLFPSSGATEVENRGTSCKPEAGSTTRERAAKNKAQLTDDKRLAKRRSALSKARWAKKKKADKLKADELALAPRIAANKLLIIEREKQKAINIKAGVAKRLLKQRCKPFSPDDIDEIRYKCVESLEALVLTLDPYFAKRLEPAHRCLMKALTDYRRGLPVTLLDGTVINPDSYDGFLCFFPRDTYKSTIICEFYPIWLILFWLIDPVCVNRPPAILMFQAKLEKAELHLARIKRLMCADEFYALYGDWVPKHRDVTKWDTQQYINLVGVDRGGARENAIQVASIGASFVGWHCTDKLVDDAVTEDNYSSITEQEKIKNGIRVNDNLLDTDLGKSVFTGTPYVDFDANVALQEGEFGNLIQIIETAFDEDPADFFDWAKLKPDSEEAIEGRQAIIDKYESGLHFGIRLPINKLAGKFRKQGSKFFTSQQLLDTRDQGTAIFQLSWLDQCMVTKDQARKRVKTVIICCDSAWKKQHNKGTGDDTAISAVGFDADSDPYMLELHVSDTLTEPEGMELMGEVAARWDRWGFPVRRLVKEAYGEDDGFMRRWRDHCKDNGMPVIPVIQPEGRSQVTGKENYIRQLAPHIEMGRYFFVEGLKHWDRFLKVYRAYTAFYTGKDDILDMMRQAIGVNIQPSRNVTSQRRVWQSRYRPVSQMSDKMIAPPTAQAAAGWASLKGRVA